jgi:hypothetical protein
MTLPNISSSNNWVLVWSGDFTAPTPTNNRRDLERFFPIPDISVPNQLDAELLAFSADSENLTRQKIAANVRRKYQVGLNEIENSETLTDSQQILLNQVSLVRFPKEFDSSYSLVISIPYWIRQISLSLWQYKKYANSIPLNNYQAPGDTNGIIYYLGTTAINSSTFVNPVPTQVVATSSGEDTSNGGALHNPTDRNPSTVWHGTLISPSSQFYQLDFQEKRVNLTKIVMRPRTNGQSGLRPTRIEGSNDAVNWTTIHIFTTEAIIPDNLISPDLSSADFFRYIRFQRIDSGEWWYVFSEIELYGFLSL